MTEPIPYTKPSITDLEVAYATDAAQNGWGPHCHDYIERFEYDFAQHIGVDYAIATSSCTGAMQMGLAALGIGSGDEVILADTNWIATAAPIVHAGAQPVFVDILEDSWTIDPDLVEAAITPATKAIIATHLYGNLCDMDRLLDVGARYSIPVVEDAAEAIGSQYRGVRAGAMGSFGVFSFHGTKTLTTGEGGAFVTNDAELFQRVLTLSNHGRARGQTKQFWPEAVGFKFKMSNVQAAIGCAQLSRVNELIERKRGILRDYRAQLEGLAGVSINPEPAGSINGAWMPNVVFPEGSGVTRETLISEFSQRQIDARVFFWPLSSLPMFAGEAKTPVAHSIPGRAINLPSFHDISEEQLERVVRTLFLCSPSEKIANCDG